MKMSTPSEENTPLEGSDETSSHAEPQKKQRYELMIIISSQISDPEITERVKGIKDRLGDEIVFEEIWGMRDFSYPIKKQKKGHYVVWNFMMTPDEIKTFEDSMKLYPDLLRYLIVSVPAEYTPISMKEVDAGLEKLREEKAEIRGKKSGPSIKKKEAPKKAEAPKEEVKEEAPKEEVKEEEAPAVEEKPAEEVSKEETTKEETPKEEVKEEVKEEKPAEKSEREKTLDEKLDSILSDEDLGL